MPALFQERHARMLRVALLLLLLLLPTPRAQAQEPSPGVFADRILFGQSAAFEGPASALGLEMRRGILAAFEEQNAAGGIDGRRLELVSYDDGYEPERAVANTQRLIEQDRVFALIGPVGTPTSAAAAPLAVDAGVPLIGPFTGAEFLRDPKYASVVNLRASYFQETGRIVAWLTGEMGLSRISVLYQDDSYGRAGLAGMRQALGERSMVPASLGAYTRNTTAVKRALLAIRAGNPQAVVIIGAYEPSALFVRWAHKLGLYIPFVNVSFVGSNALVEALEGDYAGSYISQVVPAPESDLLPLLARYRAAMRASAPEASIGFVSLEGYLAGRLAIAVLQTMQGPPTREGFLATLREQGSIDLDGFLLVYGEGDNQGSDAVFLTRIDEAGAIVPLDEGAE